VKTKARKINRMDEFEINEVSSVDLPAQLPARALLMKALEDSEIAKRVRLVSVADGHQHLIDLSGDHGETSWDMAEGNEFNHSHPWVRNDDNSITIGLSDGHTHTVIEKRLTEKDLTTLSGEPASSGGGQTTEDILMKTKTDEEIAAAEANAAVEKRIEKLEGDLAKASALASLTDVQKAHYGALPSDDQDGFLKASPEERQAQVEKAAGDDPVVYTTLDGQEIRKSNGSLVLSLAKRADKNEADLAVEKVARERETFAKRAKEELGNLPGDESAQVALLKAVAGIPGEADRKAVGEMLAAANEGISKGFQVAGSITGEEGGPTEAEAKLSKLAEARAEKNGVTFEKAYSDVLQTPAGRELYIQSKRS
jgi:hypothetical protein